MVRYFLDGLFNALLNELWRIFIILMNFWIILLEIWKYLKLMVKNNQNMMIFCLIVFKLWNVGDSVMEILQKMKKIEEI